MISMVNLCRSCVVLLFGYSLVSQQTWKVDCTGAPGSHFTDLPAAVAASAPGDTILVYSTVGSTCVAYYTAPLVDRPIRIVGFTVGGQPGNNTPGGIGVVGSLQITGIPAGQQVILTNISIGHSSANPSPITVVDCEGSVVLDNIYFGNVGTPGQDLRVERCDHVVVRGSTFNLGGDPFHIVDSNVLFTNAVVYTNPPFPWFGVGYTVTTETLRLVRSTVTLSGSIIYGSPNYGGALIQRSAATLDDSTLRIGASCTIRGGRLPNTTGTAPSNFAVAYQFTAPAPSLVEVDARVPPFSYVPSQAPVVTPIHETFHDWVVADEWFHVRVLGPQGGFALLTMGSMAFPTPSPLGELGIDMATMYPIELVPLPPADGFYQWNFFCPSSAPVDFAFALQAAMLSPTGVLSASTPSPLVPAWDKTRIP